MLPPNCAKAADLSGNPTPDPNPPITTPLWLRWMALPLSALTLLWLPVEDLTSSMPIVIAASWCLWLAARYLLRRNLSRHDSAPATNTLTGLITGLMIPLLALLLMILKSGLHAHGFQDFPLVSMRRILAALPWSGLAGLALGLVFNLRR
jgi:hypothetical protein